MCGDGDRRETGSVSLRCEGGAEFRDSRANKRPILSRPIEQMNCARIPRRDSMLTQVKYIDGIGSAADDWSWLGVDGGKSDSCVNGANKPHRSYTNVRMMERKGNVQLTDRTLCAFPRRLLNEWERNGMAGPGPG